MPSRREFLKSAALLALAPTVPGFLARTARAATPKKGQRVLVVVQLDGGNDALNTIIPHSDPQYAKVRQRLRIAPKDALKLTDAVGLHPQLRPLDKLLQAGQLAAIPGVGYPNPNRSHFRSMAIWQTARFDPEEHTGYGWIGRALDAEAGQAMLIGTEGMPVALRGRRSSAISLSRLDDLTLADPLTTQQSASFPPASDDLLAFVQRQTVDAFAASDRLAGLAHGGDEASYPGTGLGERLRLLSRLLKADLGTRIFYCTQSGFDTHASQQFQHANLMNDFGSAVAAFFADLQAAKIAERVTLLAFSEFGRTIKENASAGTDHGTAGAVFVAGPGVQGGLCGSMPSLSDLKDGEPTMTTDFRRVYATLLTGWLNLSVKDALGADFEPVGILRKSS